MRFPLLSLLGLSLVVSARVPELPGNLASARICVLRVEFIEDYTDSTTGNGQFLSEHGREYSIDVAGQVEAYFADVSGGRQDFDLSVYPAQGDGGYLMPHQMEWYGDNDRWPSAVIWLLVHAVQAADSEVDFSQYEGVMVVHAGTGREGDVLGNSPLDISSHYISSNSFQYYIGLEDPWMAGGVPTNDGVLVNEGVIVPEHQTQDGLGLGVVGVMVGKLLRWLGAPDLYNTSTGSVAIGGWDVMGYGQWLMYGFWPSAPGAFTREHLGWADVVEVYDGSFTISPGDTVYRVPLSDSEYLLIENRQRDPDGNGQCGAHERDFGLPGSGILVWHIDETRLGSHLAGNTINVDPDHQGVSVVEADGIPDFNTIYYDFFYTSEGSRWDPWMRDGYAWLLGPSTIPSTSASWGGRTGVTVDVTSGSGNSMAFTVTREGIEGWPRRVSNPASGLTVWNAEGYGEIVAVLRKGGRIEALSPSGGQLFSFGAILACAPVIALIDGSEYLFTGDRNGFVHMLTPQWGQEAPGWPVRVGSEPVQVLYSDRLQAAVAVVADSVHVLSPAGDPLPGWPRRFNYGVQGVCIIPDPVSPGIAVTVADGSLYAFDLAGRPLFSGVHPGGSDISVPVSSDFDRDGTQEIALTVRGCVFSYDASGELEPGFPAALGGEALGGLFPADPDGNGYIDLVVETTTGAHAVTPSGTIPADWPVTALTDTLSEEADRFNRGLGGSGFAGFSMRDGRTGLWNGAAQEVPGTLWSLGDGPVGRPLLWKFSGDETYRLMGIAAGGWIGAWPVSFAPQGWHTGLDRGGEGCWWPEDLPDKTTPGILAEQGFFVWPNPVLDGTGYIRFTPGADCSYTVRVFNVAGELVGLFQGNAPGGSPWEVEWETSRLSPGLYYVCLQVVTDGGTSEAVFHAAVVN